MRNILIALATISSVGFVFLRAVLAFDKTLTPDAASEVLMLAGVHGVGAVGCWLLVMSLYR